ncbi:MAG: hypothetical protein SWE60_23350 [Thermodesulfobacteriota bacterium]|nr:hypothetical protein [Thermodesulfobacteriota bacterium]
MKRISKGTNGYMKENRTPLSKAASYKEIGEFWSGRDLADFGEWTKPAEFDVEITSERRCSSFDPNRSPV